MTIAQNYVAAIVMYAVGFQLPGLYYERKASSLLDAQDRQVAIFVGTTADGLANGRTINEALWQAALLMREEPMHSIAQNYLKRIGGNVSIADAVADMAKEVNTPSFLFFADLVATVKNVGTDGNNSFEVLDYKFHEEEDIQSDMRVRFPFGWEYSFPFLQYLWLALLYTESLCRIYGNLYRTTWAG
ncbi:MAG: hypothetical protein NHB14_15700 [Desulfosporosinus sp.]|nr:hypothetical protein [Desulfosporosinus sp.]